MVTAERNQRAYPRAMGDVQFSTPDYSADQYQPPIDIPARDLLHRILYAQKKFRDKKQRWAENLEELKLIDTRHESFVNAPCFVISNDPFQASIEIHTKENTKIYVFGKIVRYGKNYNVQASDA